MGQVIPFPRHRIQRRRRVPRDVFARHFEILKQLAVWDRLAMAGLAFVTLCAVV